MSYACYKNMPNIINENLRLQLIYKVRTNKWLNIISKISCTDSSSQVIVQNVPQYWHIESKGMYTTQNTPLFWHHFQFAFTK